VAVAAERPVRPSARFLRAAHGWLILALLPLPLLCDRILYWPLYLVVPLAAYALCSATVPGLRQTFPKVRAGRLGRDVLTDAALVSAAASAAFIFLRRAILLDLSHLRVMLPNWSPAVLVLSGLLFVALNSLLEELIWRGLIFSALAHQFGPRGALVVQALGFGLSHVFFLPRAALGIGLAFCYGLLLGWLKRRAGGIAAPVLAHAVMDATLLALILLSIRHG
jgi:membrane protease YdiL (CAAX protease family)